MYGHWKYVYIATFVLVGFITVFPLLSVGFGSFWGAPPGAVGSFTLSGYLNTYGSDPVTYGVLYNSLFIATVKTVLAITIGVFLTWVVVRTDTPGRRVLEILVTLPFFIPPVLTTLAYALLGSPKVGLINVALMKLPGIDSPPVDMYSMPGIIFNMSLSSTAFVVLMIAPAFRNMDPSLEDSSRMSGAGNISTLFRVTLPVMKPAIIGAFLLSFIRGLESFDVPVILGIPAGIFVFTTKIYDKIVYRDPPQYAEGMALAVSLVAMCLLVVVIMWRLLGQREYTTITGKGYQPRLIKLGRARWIAFACCVAFFVISVVLPASQLLLSSFFRIFGFYTPEMFTLDNYGTVLGDPIIWRSFRNTALIGGGAAVATATLAGLIAYFANRTKLRGRKGLDLVAWLPWTVPGTVLGLGMLWGYILLPGPLNLYGTPWILLVAYMTSGLPLATRVMTGTIVQISHDLEESSRVHGASRGVTLWRIVAPLVRPGFLAGAILLFFTNMRDLSASILLYSPGNEVVPVVILRYWQAGGAQVVTVIALLMLAFVMVFKVLEVYLRRVGVAE